MMSNMQSTDIRRVFQNLNNEFPIGVRGAGHTYARLYMAVGAALQGEDGVVLSVPTRHYSQHVISTLDDVAWKTGAKLVRMNENEFEIRKGDIACPVLIFSDYDIEAGKYRGLRLRDWVWVRP